MSDLPIPGIGALLVRSEHGAAVRRAVARAELAEALRVAALTKPVDCTCDGLHSSDVIGLTKEELVDCIRVDAMWGACPAELRAMQRVLDRVWTHPRNEPDPLD